MSKQRAIILQKAEFDPRIKKYVLYTVLFVLVVTVIGIIFIPFWLLLGKSYINRYYNSLHCELTTRALHFKKGVWFHTERTIPLDKIQDLTFREGPLLRYLGLSTLRVETAGQSAQAAADLSLTGIVKAQEFRGKVLDQRDIVTDNTSGRTTGRENEEEETIHILKDIRDSLRSIESKLSERRN